VRLKTSVEPVQPNTNSRKMFWVKIFFCPLKVFSPEIDFTGLDFTFQPNNLLAIQLFNDKKMLTLNNSYKPLKNSNKNDNNIIKIVNLKNDLIDSRILGNRRWRQDRRSSLSVDSQIFFRFVRKKFFEIGIRGQTRVFGQRDEPPFEIESSVILIFTFVTLLAK